MELDWVCEADFPTQPDQIFQLRFYLLLVPRSTKEEKCGSAAETMMRWLFCGEGPLVGAKDGGSKMMRVAGSLAEGGREVEALAQW